jgi:hypothetical protein
LHQKENTMTKKQKLERAEFAGNYTLAHREEVHAIIRAYRDRRLRKDDLRVYAAILEERALHGASRVDRARVINSRASVTRALSTSAIRRASSRIKTVTAACSGTGKRVAIAREMVRYIAQGRATCTEAMVLFYYCLRRIKQLRRRELLQEGERYARFRYRDLAELSGCGRSSLCRAVGGLREAGLLEVVRVQQQNENANGNLFVDGPLVSLTSHVNRSTDWKPRTTTGRVRSDNAPGVFSTTLENRDPKTVIRKRKEVRVRFVFKDDGRTVVRVVERPTDRELELARLQARAWQIEQAQLDAVA